MHNLKCDLPEVFVIVCDSLEGRDDPLGSYFGMQFARERHLIELCRFREVDRPGRRAVCKRG